MLWERINTKPLITTHFFNIFDKANNFATLIAAQYQYPHTLRSKNKTHITLNLVHSELNKVTSSF